MNNPIPSNLKSEAKKAAKILKEFTEITSRTGPDKIIPRWSAPSAIGVAGLGGGFEIGIEVSDLVIILNHKRAVKAFAKGGNLTLGGNFTVAMGPLGRNLEGDLAIRSSAAVYTYCKSRGLFLGISLEGSALIERKDTNRKFYCQEDIRAYDILFGDVPCPEQANELYEILESFTETYEYEEQNRNMRKAAREQREQRRVRQSTSRPRPQSFPAANGNEGSSRSERMTATALYPFEGQHPGDLKFQAGDKITVITNTDLQFDWWEGKLKGKTGIFPANYVQLN
ncbi:SH3 domain-containing YSC84-like protein 1 isoform X2 [Bombina bombina]|uniref:SH3 domain-containing YSC84-like protein 1 isoform X2 n=1 Tax=Bombina bombina TaxID=8345 RepID=UPI00235AC2C5|nr:SH3 domain-containing YSC84-like protein 1 isoform X2 [Bombina bombina]